MTLQKTDAKNIEERMKEVIKSNSNIVINYKGYDTLPEIKPFGGLSENIRFYSDGLEILVDVDHNRTGTIRHDTNKVQLINEIRKGVLTYSFNEQK